MTGGGVCVELTGAVATILLEPVDRATALDSCTRAQLLLALDRVASDARVRAVVLSGGGHDFCDGHDLEEYARRLARDPHLGLREIEAQTAQVVHALAAVPQPVIAAVRGRCVGEGLALALACDLRVLADDTVLRTSTSVIGASCGGVLRSTLAPWVGEERARELLLSGRRFSAREAVEWGLVAEVVPTSHVLDLAHGQAAMIARLPAAAAESAKVMLAGAAAVELERALGGGAPAALSSAARSQRYSKSTAATRADRSSIPAGR